MVSRINTWGFLLHAICMVALLGLAEGKATLVTFRVDLSQQASISPNGVHVLGTFNGFDPIVTPLANVGPGQYAVGVNLNPGEQHLYKFVNGNTWLETEGVYGDCAFNTYRIFTVPANDTVLPWVCFGHCDSACTPVSGIRLACVGNSITFGLGLTHPELASYPSQMQSMLGPGYFVGNFGASGTTVIRASGNPYVQADPFRHLLRFAPDTVVLLLGINDSKSAVWGPHGSRFAADYDSLWMAIDTLASHPHIFICLPTTAHWPMYGIDLSVVRDSIVPLIQAHGRKHCIDQIDMLGFTSGMASGFPDGIHPDSATSRLMAEEMLRIMHHPRPQINRNGNVLRTNGGAEWQWYLNGDTVATAMGGRNDSLVALLPGTYKVGVRVAAYQHILYSDTVVVLPVGRTEAFSMDLEVWPVPASDRFHWRVATPAAEVLNLRLVNSSGKPLQVSQTMELEGELNLSALPAGTYLLWVERGGITGRQILVKD